MVTGRRLEPRNEGPTGGWPLAEVFAHRPFAVLVSSGATS
jgi:hypothetical protein